MFTLGGGRAQRQDRMETSKVERRISDAERRL
jgi:hypothetical protein